MKKSVRGLVIFVAILMFAFMIGDFIMKAAFFGTIMLAGVATMINSIPWLRRFIARSSRTVDFIITGATVMAMAYLGLNLTAATTIAAFGYTLMYAPYLREQEYINSKKNKPRAHKRNNRNNFDLR